MRRRALFDLQEAHNSDDTDENLDVEELEDGEDDDDKFVSCYISQFDDILILHRLNLF